MVCFLIYAYDHEFITGIDDLIMEQEDINEPENNVAAPAQLPSFGALAMKASLIWMTYSQIFRGGEVVNVYISWS
ncbi:hypothetical protein KY285_023170 [Solanum tuberosum]|nr:hypothetical protein KY285_023170 [Solanum tuberosum]